MSLYYVTGALYLAKAAVQFKRLIDYWYSIKLLLEVTTYSMELIKGQNISIAPTQGLIIDIGWRSLATDLHLQAHALFYACAKLSSDCNNPQLIYSSQQTICSQITRDEEGRRYTLNLERLDTAMQQLVIVLMLPNTTAYDFSKLTNLQAFISTNEGLKLATIKINDYQPQINALSLIKIYRYKEQWKIKLLCQEFQMSIATLADHFAFETPTHWQKDSLLKGTAIHPLSERDNVIFTQNLATQRQPDRESNFALRAGVSLDMGASFSLFNDFNHVRQLTWKVRTVPQLQDIELNIMALDSQGKLRRIEDYIYPLSPRSKEDSISIERVNDDVSQAHISFDHIPDFIHTLSLIVKRANAVKRFSSADFIQTKLHSTITDINVCDFTMSSVDKNYNTIILFEIYRHKAQWKVKAIGQGYAQGVQAIAEIHGFNAPRNRHATSIKIAPVTDNLNTGDDKTHCRPESSIVSANSHSLSAPTQSIVASNRPAIVITILGAVLTAAGLINAYLLIVGCPMLSLGVYLTHQARALAKTTLAEQNERLILNLIQQNHYHITAFEIAAQSPITISQASKILDALCLGGAGQLIVNTEGGSLYNFESMRGPNKAPSRKAEQW